VAAAAAAARLGYPAAFVAQDRWDETATPWDEFDVLFVGGSTEFKLGVVRQNLRFDWLGFMSTPQMGNTLPPGAVWGADNGRFSSPDAGRKANLIGCQR
jgi:hypothetical protein